MDDSVRHDRASRSASGLRFPHREPPEPGTVREVAPGILWLRLALPYALDHVNLYLFEDGAGWAAFDAGLGDDPSREAWQRVLSQVLGGKPITRLIVSHFHPDHVGLAGWLWRRFAMPLHMAEAEYLMSKLLQLGGGENGHEAQVSFYRAAGLEDGRIAEVMGRGQNYLKRTTGLPPTFERLVAGDEIVLGGRRWRVLSGGGHAPEQIMLWCAADRLFLSADQVLARISPNVSVMPLEPNADPLSLYLASLAEIRASVPDDVLVLPCHNLPFNGLHARTLELEAHHAHRCALIAAACRDAPKTCAELIPVIFRRIADAHQMSFAVGEALAHINHMLRTGALEALPAAGPAVHYRPAG